MHRRDFLEVVGLSTVAALIGPAADGQEGWRWCRKCEGLWFAGGANREGKCAVGGTHDAAGSGRYTVPHNDEAAAGQHGWRWCHKCEGLWFADGGDARKGKCPAGDSHSATDSGKYALPHNDDAAPGQHGWRWCRKCEGLVFADGGEDRKGKCPGGGDHDTADSGKYAVPHVAD